MPVHSGRPSIKKKKQKGLSKPGIKKKRETLGHDRKKKPQEGGGEKDRNSGKEQPKFRWGGVSTTPKNRGVLSIVEEVKKRGKKLKKTHKRIMVKKNKITRKPERKTKKRKVRGQRWDREKGQTKRGLWKGRLNGETITTRRSRREDSGKRNTNS